MIAAEQQLSPSTLTGNLGECAAACPPDLIAQGHFSWSHRSRTVRSGDVGAIFTPVTSSVGRVSRGTHPQPEALARRCTIHCCSRSCF